MGGVSLCAQQGRTCSLLATDPCFTCNDVLPPPSSFQSSPSVVASVAASSAPVVLAFLNEQCAFNADCITGICRNNICVPCTADNQCSSGKCANGMCILTEVLPGQTVVPPLAGAAGDDPSLVPGADPSLVLPASTIELPFTTSNQMADGRYQGTVSINSDGQRIAANGQSVLPSAPATPATGPAAILIMISGAAAGWAFRRKKTA